MFDNLALITMTLGNNVVILWGYVVNLKPIVFKIVAKINCKDDFIRKGAIYLFFWDGNFSHLKDIDYTYDPK